MFASDNITPRKRKCSEYRDPDYNEEVANKKLAITLNPSKQILNDIQLTSNQEERIQRVREIVAREFENEINQHKEQLDEVNKSIEESIKLFDKLRYKLVADYYSKQEIAINNAEAAQLRGEHTLFVDEPKGAQLPYHPSIKKIIGNNPTTLADILRIHPKRAAAKQALTKIDEVTQSVSKTHKRREQRRLEKVIREQGIVIDHSNNIADIQQLEKLSEMVKQEQEEKPSTSSTALNTARLNNKIKHLIIVGNTSKYIGGESNSGGGQELSNERFTHKWLIYVHAKDPLLTPLENLIKKVRFYLHPSYQPSDVVDIKKPPFQLSRLGWGEFPVRLQLFFNEQLQQKPVQLLHNLLLDKTLSGLQTMGAETLVEIWLRPLSVVNSIAMNSLMESDNDNLIEDNMNKKERTVSIGQFKYEDLNNDDLLDFLNSIEDTPNPLCVDDIDQIEPTVVVQDNIRSSPKKSPSSLAVRNEKSPIKAICNESLLNTTTMYDPLPENLFTTNAESSSSITNLTRSSTIKCYPQTSKPSIICLKPSAPATSLNNEKRGIILPNNTKIIPIVRNFEKKLVQLIDTEGKIKYVQMLVSKNIPLKSNNNNNKAPSLLNSNIRNVFQKEGKLYIRDPLQNKIKQQQKQQISLLKPQIKRIAPIKLPPIHLGLKETRENKLDNNEILIAEQYERDKLEQAFERAQFESISSGVEFLLRRLPLIAPPSKNQLQAFTFICCSNLSQFKHLPALKQRVLEWLRAKYINELIKSHKQLKQHLHWSTRKVAIYARNYAFTPAIKMIRCEENKLERENVERNFQEKMRNEVKCEELLRNYNTLTSIQPINDMLRELIKTNGNESSDDEDYLNVVDVSVNRKRDENESENETHLNNFLMLSIPQELITAGQLVRDICKEIRIKLNATEEITENIRQPLAETLLAHCLRIFVENLIRRAIALQTMDEKRSQMIEEANIRIEDLARVIACPKFANDYDFYNENYMGIERGSDESNSDSD